MLIRFIAHYFPQYLQRYIMWKWLRTIRRTTKAIQRVAVASDSAGRNMQLFIEAWNALPDVEETK